jgi:hypothetical protein
MSEPSIPEVVSEQEDSFIQIRETNHVQIEPVTAEEKLTGV